MDDSTKFFIRFDNDPNPQEIQTREFDGWDDAVFTLKQHDDGFGRDEFFGSDSEGKAGNVLYGPDINEEVFEKILQTDDQYGFEGDTKQIIESDEERMELEIDYAGASTNQVDIFQTTLIQNAKLQLYKRRLETKINCFSDRTLDSEPIEPLQVKKILFKAFPIVQVSKWKTSIPDSHISYSRYTKNGPGPGSIGGLLIYQNTANSQEQGDIKSSVSNLYPYVGVSTLQVSPGNFPRPSAEALAFLDLENNLSNATVKITNLDLKVKNFIEEGPQFSFDGGDASGSAARVSLVYTIGDDINTNNVRYSVFHKDFGDTEQPEYTFPSTFTFDLPDTARGKRIYIYVETVIWGKFVPNIPSQFTPIGGYDYYRVRSIMTDANITITGTETAYNTIVNAVRLVDVMRYAVKSASGLDILPPRFDIGGEFYELMVSTGKLMQLKTNLPFYITNADILKVLIQFNADYELTEDENVFFGLFEDFYRDEEIGFIDDNRQDQEFFLDKNPKFKLNRVKMAFDSYESQRENSQPNTEDEVHGEYEGSFASKRVENTRDIKIGWTMSSRTLERKRRDAIEKTSSEATDDDDSLFGLDTTIAPLQNTNAIPYTERDELQHFYDPDVNQLRLSNDGSFSWIGLGITVNSPFVINTLPSSQPNGGSYIVAGLTNGEIILNPVGSPASSSNDGVRFTTFTYLVDVNNLDAVIYTYENTTATGIENANSYPNLRYSLGQSRLKWHDRYLATANLYTKNSQLRTTFYKNNPNAVIDGRREGGEVSPDYPDGGVTLSNPILTPRLYTNIKFSGNEIRLKTFIELSRLIRSRRGFIRFIDNKGHVHKFYPKSMSWENGTDTLVFAEGEQKYEPSQINIYRGSNGKIHVGTSYQLNEVRIEPFGEEHYVIRDQHGELLYNPFFWNRISINGNLADNKNQLNGWIQSI